MTAHQFPDASPLPRADLIRIPGMLMIGAADQNAERTEFACSIIRNLASTHHLAGIKITTLPENAGISPRGGGHPSPKNFCIVEEDGGKPHRETARMLAAGAHRAWRLSVRRAHLAEGVKALLERMPPAELLVCESGSARTAADPDLFLVVRDGSRGQSAPSCAEIIDLADGIAVSDGTRFEPAPSSVVRSGGHWTFQRRATAIVLAGGKSTRMGKDKALLPVDGVPMLQRIIGQLRPSFSEILISASKASDYPEMGCRVVPDTIGDQGPLRALASALAASSNDVNLVVPCDLPDLPQHLIARLLREAASADGVVPVDGDGRYEPLLAVYRRNMLPRAEQALAGGARRVISMYDGMKIRTIPADGEGELKNLNTMADYLARCGPA